MQVFVNLHSAHMDPDDWENPDQFRPERFLDESGNVIGRDRVIAFSLGTSTSTHIVCSIIIQSPPHYHQYYRFNNRIPSEAGFTRSLLSYST